MTSPGIQAGALSSAEWAALEMDGQITEVTLGGAPSVTFTLTDRNGNAIVGLENFNSLATSTASGACAAGKNVIPVQRTVMATIAKLVPGTNGSPSKWVNYIVAGIDPTKAGGPFCRLQTPSTDSYGTLTYLGKGQYKYVFATDITKVKAYVDASSDPFKADVGDTTYEPGLAHRVVVQIAGAARGTGTNTPDGVQVAPAVNLEDPLNLVWDSTAQQRDIARIESCNECHSHLAFHGSGARVDTDYCELCHTNQRKYGQVPSVLGTTTVKFDDGSSETVPSWTKGPGASATATGEPRKFPDGNASRDWPIMIHSIHRGEHLPVRLFPTGSDGKNQSSDYISEVVFPQPVTNCVTCHTGTGPRATPQGDNFKNNPNRIACGACHNNINWVTGANHGDNGVGGARADDSQCKSCHTADAISKIYHVSVDPTGSVDRGGYPPNTANNVPTPGYPSGQGPAIPLASSTNPPAGVPKVAYDLAQVTVAPPKVTFKYRILFDGSPVTFLPAGNTYLLANIDGTPSLYATWGKLEDGVTTVVDWTDGANATVKQCRDGTTTANFSCTQTGPDASGYYTATLTVTSPTSPLKADSKLVTGMLGINYQGFVKLDHANYPKGIRLREPAFAIKTADGQTARRVIVEAARCNKCHDQLGVEPSFHSGARNNPQGCATGGCHHETKSTGHVGEAYDFGGGWAVSAKSMVHAIHGASKREQPFSYEATEKNQKGFGVVAYPGVLNNCEQCHVPGSYDFGNTTNSVASTNLLWTTDANGDMRNPQNKPSIGLSPWINMLGKGQIDYRGDHLVSSPIASACFACHDSQVAVRHFQDHGGILLKLVSEITGATPAVYPAVTDRSGLDAKNVETCLLCHASGRVADVKVMHQVKGVQFTQASPPGP